MGFVTCKAETDGDTCALCKTCACFGCRRWGYCFESSSTEWVCSGCVVYGRATMLNLGCYCRNCSARVGAKWALEQKGLPFVATKHVMQFLWARSSQTEENNVALEREREHSPQPPIYLPSTLTCLSHVALEITGGLPKGELTPPNLRYICRRPYNLP